MLLAHQPILGRMRWNTSKYALLTFPLTPLFPARILFSQLYSVTDARSVWSLSNKEIETENTLTDFLFYGNPGLLGACRSAVCRPSAPVPLTSPSGRGLQGGESESCLPGDWQKGSCWPLAFVLTNPTPAVTLLLLNRQTKQFDLL